MSGSCASRMTGASSVTLASVPSRSSTPSNAAPAPLAAALDEGHLVAEAGEPEAAAVLDEAHDVVLVDGDALALQHAPAEHRALARALGGEVVPPVVVAEDGVHAERRLELAQRLGPYPPARRSRVLNLWLAAKSPSSTMTSGFERVGLLDDAADALGRHRRAAGVHVGDDADLELQIARPVGRGDAVARDLEAPARLDGEAIARQPDHAGAGKPSVFRNLRREMRLQVVLAPLDVVAAEAR